MCSPGQNFCTVRVIADNGLYGLGDATLNGREQAVAAYLIEHIVPLMAGRDPFDIEDTWQYLYRGAYWRRGPVTMAAISAIDVALWDLKGKALSMARDVYTTPWENIRSLILAIDAIRSIERHGGSVMMERAFSCAPGVARTTWPGHGSAR